jgi:hypothetical protein
VEQAVDGLWSKGSLETGQVRLRNMLARLNADCGDIVRREGLTLVLDAVTDLTEYGAAPCTVLSFGVAELALDTLYLGAPRSPASRPVSDKVGEIWHNEH